MTLDKNNALDLAQYLSEWLYELECPITSHLLAKMINTYIEGDAAADAA